jgi:hypothetical protein
MPLFPLYAVIPWIGTSLLYFHLHNVVFTFPFLEMSSIEIFLKGQAKKICGEDMRMASDIVNTELSESIENLVTDSINTL